MLRLIERFILCVSNFFTFQVMQKTKELAAYPLQQFLGFFVKENTRLNRPCFIKVKLPSQKIYHLDFLGKDNVNYPGT